MLKKQILSLLVLLLIVSCNKSNQQSNNNSSTKQIKVSVVEIDNKTIGETLTYNGAIEPKVSTPISFLLPGTVNSIYVEEGDWVKKGQILAKIDDISQQNAYKGTLAALNQAKDAFDRLKSVYDKGSLPEIQMQEVTSQLEQAKSANSIAYQNLLNCTLKAPSSGFIGSRNVEVGSSSIPGSPVFNLVSLNEVYVKIAVPENEINQLKKEQKVAVVIPAIGNKEFFGYIEKIGVIANMLTKTYEVKILLKNPDLIIKSGMACDVSIKTNPHNGKITIPYRSVLKEENGRPYVFKVLKDKTVSKIYVELGAFINNNIEILSGLEKGDVIITDGQHKLSENDIVIF
ncbi:efflux RND transporter periplasmic adaptor subunit [Seonamhaeicola sp. NFXS20]|uniref:efflux RND transporter periplasmic adaptor subunit n=1 Tax=unclassified Seonamhaeicola TaxID=2622645 RepID=UPI003567DE42